MTFEEREREDLVAERRRLISGPCSDMWLSPELRRDAWAAVASIDERLGVDSDSIAFRGLDEAA